MSNEMKEEAYKQWLCEKAGYKKFKDVHEAFVLPWFEIPLEVLIKAMWAINRNSERFEIIMYNGLILVKDFSKMGNDRDQHFKPINYNNNSETEALDVALKHIYKEVTNENKTRT